VEENRKKTISFLACVDYAEEVAIGILKDDEIILRIICLGMSRGP
jgi:hypothetical protein